MGKLAMPSLLAQALSPSLGAILIEWSGPGAALGFLTGMTCLNIALVGLLGQSQTDPGRKVVTCPQLCPRRPWPERVPACDWMCGGRTHPPVRTRRLGHRP